MKTEADKSLFKPIVNLKISLEKSLPEIIIKLFTLDSLKSYRLFFYLLLGIISALALIFISIGIPPINALPTDISILLDSGWRIINGQTPHIDYYSPLGMLTGLTVAFGMKVGTPSASAIAYGNVLLLAILTPWAWLIARSRLSACNAFLFSLFISLLLIAPRALGTPIGETTYAMLYNRQAFALLSMLLIEIFILPRDIPTANHKFWSGVSTGILLALLFCCKVNYFAVALICILLHILFFRISLPWLLGLAGGAICLLAGFYFCFKLNFPAYLADISLAAQSQNKIQKLHNIKGAFIDNFFWLYLSFVLIFINPLEPQQSSAKQTVFWWQSKLQAIAVSVVIFGVLICGTNAQTTDIPLFFVAGLILLENLRRDFLDRGYSANSFLGLKHLFTILIVTLFGGTILLQDLGSVAASIASYRKKPALIAQSEQLKSQTLSDLLLMEASADYPPTINDGLNLLSPYVKQDSRVMALDFANPFSLALELPPPVGDALWWHYHHTFDERSFPKAEKVFQQANLIIIPKQSDEGSGATKYLQEIYGGYLDRHFQKQDKSMYWTLWTRQ